MASQDEVGSPLDSPSPPESPLDTPDSDASPPPVGSPTHPGVAPRTTANVTTASVPNMTTSSTPLGNLNAARGKPPGPAAPRGGSTPMNADIMAKMKAFSVSRQGPPTPGGVNRGPMLSQPQVPAAGGAFPAGFKLPPQLPRPQPQTTNSSPATPGGAKAPAKGMSLAEKRGMKMPGGLPGAAPPGPQPAGGGRAKPKMTLSQMGGGPPNGEASGGQPHEPPKQQSEMEKYAEYVDTKTGALNFKGKATLHGGGIDFKDGRSFNISLDQVDTMDELGKGNYGTVYKVRHSRPRFRKAGQGLAGNKARGPSVEEEEPQSPTRSETTPTSARGGTTGKVMAMKEIRLELDDLKFAQIIMELDILHKCISPYIVDFYGAFFQEGSVYIALEFMDGGSIDRLYGDGIPESVLRKITFNTVMGLKFLKEEHNIIHRDVKPTNILVNQRGQVKICDFGVSGNLVASIAKTNIGCQSYMAPERISSGGMASAGAVGGTYNVQSDIWSLGLTLIECALGRYPYPPETYDNIFSQLSAIVDGAPPDLPADTFSEASRDFVAGCLNKIPKLRPTYPMLLQHAWLAPLVKPETIVEEDEEAAEAAAENDETPAPDADAGAAGDGEEGFVDREVGEWVVQAIDRRKRGVMGKGAKPALHAAPLDAMGSSPAEVKPVAVDA